MEGDIVTGFRESVEISAPPHVVWDLITDIRRHAEFAGPKSITKVIDFSMTCRIQDRRTGHPGRMDVELLVVPDCPNEVSAYDLTRTALAELDVSASVTTTVIESDEQAQARGFTGSPTFLINGRDPFAEPGAGVGVACRVYRTPDGLAGVPTLEELREELRRTALA